MSGMFGNATEFNGDVSSWDVSSLEYIFGMFNGASEFKQQMCGWTFQEECTECSQIVVCQ